MVEQFLPVVSIERNSCVNTRIMIFVLVIIILMAVIKNLTNPGIFHCIDTEKIEISNQTNVDEHINKLNLNTEKYHSNQTKSNQTKSISDIKKEKLMNADIVNMNYIDRMKEHKNIVGKFIEIRNNNRKEIPLNKIIVMNDNRKLIQLLEFTTQQTKTGVIYTYIIPEPEKIRQIILDICIYNSFIDNVKTSQVSVLDDNKKVIWKYNNIINTDRRYHYIDISDPKIVYDRPNNLLCTNTDEECSQEKKLIISLAENIWQS
mgnify:CR=1 FL=1